MPNINRNQGRRARVGAAERQRANRRQYNQVRQNRQPAREGSLSARVMKVVAAAIALGAAAISGVTLYDRNQSLPKTAPKRRCEDSTIGDDIRVRMCYHWVQNPVLGKDESGESKRSGWFDLLKEKPQEERGPDYMWVRQWQDGKDPDYSCTNLNKNKDYCQEVNAILASSVQVELSD